MEAKGKINIYECANGHQTITVNADEGTTPMIMSCRTPNCGQRSTSKWYMVDQNLTPVFEWYKPTDLKKLNPAEREHVKLGGLLIRKIKPSPPKTEKGL